MVLRIPLTVPMALLLLGCAGGPRLDPERSAELAASVTQASTTTGPELRSEDAVKRPGERPKAMDPLEKAVLAAVANPDRPASDRVRDNPRQSGAVLRFFRISPGMRVLDLYSGGGYYTELLSYVVGTNGHVVAHNNTPYLEFAKADLPGRFAGGRLPNVERLLAENNALKLPAGSFDAVLMTNVYHDIYFVDEKAGWPRIDGPKLLAEVIQSLKPGGVLALSDFIPVAWIWPQLWLNFVAGFYGACDMRYSLSRYRRLARDTGFRPVVERNVNGHTLPTFAFLKSVEPLLKEYRRHSNLETRMLHVMCRLGLLRYSILAFEKI